MVIHIQENVTAELNTTSAPTFSKCLQSLYDGSNKYIWPLVACFDKNNKQTYFPVLHCFYYIFTLSTVLSHHVYADSILTRIHTKNVTNIW
jgi:hypothetical protein